jgi:hypothetical protein
MATFFDNKNNFILRDVPKGGGTTIRNWIGYYMTGELKLVASDPTKDFYYNDDSVAKHIKSNGYVMDLYTPHDGDAVCVKRDPVERFVSCYADKIMREGWLKVSLSDLIDNFDTYVDKDADHKQGGTDYGFIWYHFAPQVHQLGPSRDNYTKVFDINEMSDLREYLQDKWSIELPELHCRNNKKRAFRLSPKQIAKVEEIYKDDYQAGWC